jgi:mono/diheme cytochrome c family protein
MMRVSPLTLLVRTAALAAFIQATACNEQPKDETATPAAPKMSETERGAYLVVIGGCHDCHTPKVFGPNGPDLDTTRMLSGHPKDEKLPSLPATVIGPTKWGAVTNNGLTAWVGPWGTSFTANLTPHQTGLYSWSVENFIQTLRTGKHWGNGRPILPPMPWQTIGKMTDEDLRSIFAYLRTLKPVDNQVPLPIPPAGAPAS